MNPELDFWAGAGGDAYQRRNAVTDTEVKQRATSLGSILWTPSVGLGPSSLILEVGAGPGSNLRALKMCDFTNLYAVEPNATARAVLATILSSERVYDGHTGAIPAADGTFDLVMTAGVLIHVHPDRLRDCMVEIARVSRRYVLAIEYFAPTCEPVVYYGAERIWRNDFGKLYLDLGLQRVSNGFFWKQADEGYDNTVWTLLEKPVGWRADEVT